MTGGGVGIQAAKLRLLFGAMSSNWVVLGHVYSRSRPMVKHGQAIVKEGFLLGINQTVLGTSLALGSWVVRADPLRSAPPGLLHGGPVDQRCDHAPRPAQVPEDAAPEKGVGLEGFGDLALEEKVSQSQRDRPHAG